MKKTTSTSQKASAFFQKSQEKINNLRKKLSDLSQKRRDSEEDEKFSSILPKSELKHVKISISIESVVKATVAIFLLMALVNVLGIMQGVIILFLVALFLSATFNPAVEKLHHYKIPRSLGIILIYILVIGIFVIMFTNLVPIIADQIGQLAGGIRIMIENLITGQSTDSWIVQKIQPYANQIWQNVDQAQVISSVSDTLSKVATGLTGFAGNAIGAILSVFNGIFNLILVLTITFFMVVHAKDSSVFFRSLFPHRYAGYIALKSKQISIRIGEWVRGQVFLALAMGILTFTLLSIIGLDYALTLALVSALGEFIPYLGPFITFGSALLIAFNQDPVMVLWLIPVYLIIQFIESNIFVPLIVGRSVGLNPIVVIFALLAGASLGYSLGGGVGLAIVGMIVAVPTANIISLFVEDYTEKNK